MTNEILNSSESLPSQELGATDSLWQPSWLHWLISALSGTVEIEKQTAWLRKENERLAELELKLDTVLHKSDSSLNPMKSTDES